MTMGEVYIRIISRAMNGFRFQRCLQHRVCGWQRSKGSHPEYIFSTSMRYGKDENGRPDIRSCNNLPSYNLVAKYSSVAASPEQNGSSRSLSNVKQFLDIYRHYTTVYGLANLRFDGEKATIKEIKRNLKSASSVLAKDLENYDMPTALALLLCTQSIVRSCKLTELSVNIIEYLLKQLTSSEVTFTASTAMFDSIHIDGCFSKEALEALKTREKVLPFILRSLRLLDIKSPSKDVLDALFTLVNANLYQWSTKQLVEISRDLAWICRFCEDERFSGTLRKCISLVYEGSGRTAVTLSHRQIINLLKAASVISVESQSLNSRLVRLIEATMNYEEPSSVSELSRNIDNLYQQAKGNIHLINVMLISGLCLETTVVQRLLEVVMNFCLEYFSATSKVWRLKPPSVVTEDYNKIDKRVADMLYAKCQNKVFLKIGSLSEQVSNEEAGPKIEERHQAIMASLGRLLQDNKIAFCRGLKLCDLRLRVLNRQVYQGLSNEIHMFLNGVSRFRFSEPAVEQDVNFVRALRHLGYRPVTMMLDGSFLLNCIDYDKRLYCELCNTKQARQSQDGVIVYNKHMELKLMYLEQRGWRGAIILESEWKGHPEDLKIATLRTKLEALK